MKKLARLFLFSLAALQAGCGGGSGSSASASTPATAPASAPTTAGTNYPQEIMAQASTLTSISPATVDDGDLAAFGNAVGNRSIVILGEQTDGDGASFALQTRLVKYLHENKGFNVLILESGMYDIVRMQQRLAAGGASLSTQAPGRIYYMISDSAAGQAALQYVDSTLTTAAPLTLWGDDIPMDGADSATTLLPNLQSYLTSQNSSLPASADWPGYLRVAQQGVSLNNAAVNGADATSFLNMSAQLIGTLCAAQPDTATNLLQSAGFWCRMVSGVQADYAHLWSATDPRTPTDTRDLTEAGNIAWLLNGRLKGQKAIIWTNSAHAINGLRSAGNCNYLGEESCGPGWTNMGTNVVNAFGSQVYISNITAGQGIFNAYPSSPCAPAPAGDTLPPLYSGMLEYYLASSGSPMFLPYPTDAGLRSFIATLSIDEIDFAQDAPNAYFGTGYQGLFFLPQLSPAVEDCSAYPVIAYP